MKQIAFRIITAVALFLPSNSALAEGSKWCGEVEELVSVGPGLELNNRFENPSYLFKAGLDVNQLHEDVTASDKIDWCR